MGRGRRIAPLSRIFVFKRFLNPPEHVAPLLAEGAALTGYKVERVSGRRLGRRPSRGKSRGAARPHASVKDSVAVSPNAQRTEWNRVSVHGPGWLSLLKTAGGNPVEVRILCPPLQVHDPTRMAGYRFGYV
jgi:hypothetical protein